MSVLQDIAERWKEILRPDSPIKFSGHLPRRARIDSPLKFGQHTQGRQGSEDSPLKSGPRTRLSFRGVDTPLKSGVGHNERRVFGRFADEGWERGRQPDDLLMAGADSAWQAARGRFSNMWGPHSPMGEGLVTGGNPAQASPGLSGVRRWQTQLQQVAREFGMPWEVLGSIMAIESGGNPNVRSHAGAVGLMQIVPRFWQGVANRYGGNLMDPMTNMRTAAHILRDYHRQFGDWAAAARAYFAGPGNMNNLHVSDGLSTVGRYDQMFRNNLAALAGTAVGGAVGAVSGAAGRAIDFMRQHLGRPYVWGGSSPQQGFDCSGLMQWAFRQAGINLPRTAGAQYDATRRINASQARRGDLVFFHSTYNNPHHWITHVGVYLGNGQMLHSGTNGIEIVSINTPYWQQRLAGFGRAA